MMMTFGERLKDARKSAKLTQIELSRLVGVDQSSVSEAESSGLSSTKVLEYAKALNVNPNWLATGKGPRDNKATHPLDEHKKVFDEADEVSQRLILTMLASLKNNKRTPPDDRLHPLQITPKPKQAQNQ